MYWWQRNPNRFLGEVKKVKTHFPGFYFREEKEGERLLINYYGTLKPNDTEYLVKISIPDGYPHEIPSVFVLNPELRPCEHRWRTGDICIMEREDWNANMAIISVITQTSSWLFQYEYFLRYGTWGGRGAHERR